MSIGNGCYIIAEIAQNHDGNLNIAHGYIDLAADLGFDAVKFQTHFADHEATLQEPWRVQFSRMDPSRFDYWKRMEFSPDEWVGLAEHASSRNIDFLSSPFSVMAVEILKDCRMPYWKIASGELSNYPMIDRICELGGELILSCGLFAEEEIAEVIERIRERGGRVAGILECTSKYPTPLEEINIARMVERASAYDAPIGLSDHSGDVVPAIAAITNGASFIEVHLTYHRNCFGPDVVAAIDPEQSSLLLDYRDKFFALGSKTDDKDNKTKLQSLFGKTIYCKANLKAGERVKAKDIAYLKPANGISAKFYESVIGKVLLTDVQAGEPLHWSQIK